MMSNVKNRKVIRRLAWRKILSEKHKNFVAVMAIMLTCILFTTVFTIGSILMKSSEESTMRQVGGTAHVGVKYMLPKDYEILSKDHTIKEQTYRIYIGAAENEELLKTPTEISFAEDKYAKWTFSEPTTGTMPREYKDIAVSTLVLDALGIPHELGQEVPLTFSVNNKIITEEFNLCGFWQGDVVSMAQMAYVSKEYCMENVPVPATPYHENESGDITGYWQMDVFFDNSFDIEGQIINLLERNGYDPNHMPFGVNWAYGMATVDAGTIMLLALILGIITLSGYLIIYNIFYIRVSGDIRSYGLFKTIGTTAKQLKRIVYLQAVILSVAGIPAGLIVGYFMGIKLLPVIVRNFNMYLTSDIRANIWVFAGAAAFTMVTVLISCIRPCRIASKVSPIEAVRFVEEGMTSVKKKVKKTVKVSTISMAFSNLSRNRKKVVLVVMSLSLSLILVNCVYCIVNGFDMDKYLAQCIRGDFIIKDATLGNVYSQYNNVEGITEDIVHDIKSSGFESDVQSVYYTEMNHILTGQACLNMEEIIENNPHYFAHTEKGDAYYLEKIQQTHNIWVQMYGMDEGLLEYLELVHGTLDMEKFKSGKYIIVDTYSEADEVIYLPGDKVNLEFSDGTKKEYEVLAVAGVPYPLSCQWYFAMSVNMILPTSEFLNYIDAQGAMLSVVKMDNENDIQAMESWFSNYCANIRNDMTFYSKAMYEEEFRQLQLMFWVVGGVLSFILALIGILNFVNSIVTGILSRQREFAMMEAVGMTGRQLKGMLAWEGILYAIFTSAFALTAGMGVCYMVVEFLAGQMWFFTWKLSIVPILICIPVLLILSYIIPIMAHKSMLKQSVVERLRVNE